MNNIGMINIGKPQYFNSFLTEQAKNIIKDVDAIESEFKKFDNIESVDLNSSKGDVNTYSASFKPSAKINYSGELKTDKKTGETQSFYISKHFYPNGSNVDKANIGDGTYREITCTKNDLGNGNVQISRTIDFAKARNFEKHIETIVYNKNTGEIQSLNSNHDF